MRNFVDYGQQAPFIPSLFIGYVQWPWGWDHSFEFDGSPAYVEMRGGESVSVKLELPDMITLTEHQTSGHMCAHIQLFGVFFHLNDRGLYRAARDHGPEDAHAPMPWMALVNWHVELNLFGLRFEGTEYQHAQEAFMPFGGKSAWEYAKRKNLNVILPTGGRGEKCGKVFPTYDDLDKYLYDAYETARVWRPDGVKDDLATLVGCIYAPPCGAIVYENCD